MYEQTLASISPLSSVHQNSLLKSHEFCDWNSQNGSQSLSQLLLIKSNLNQASRHPCLFTILIATNHSISLENQCEFKCHRPVVFIVAKLFRVPICGMFPKVSLGLYPLRDLTKSY